VRGYPSLTDNESSGEANVPVVPIRIPNLLGGVSRMAQSLRAPSEFEEMVNVELDPVRGAQKRPGTQLIIGKDTVGVPTTRSELPVNVPTNPLHFFWINRAEGERFVGIIDPVATDQDKVIQVFDLDGKEQVVEGDLGTSLPLSDPANATLLAYLAAGTGDLRRRLRVLTVEDASFFLNRTVKTGLTGSAITYELADLSDVRQQSNIHNKPAWSEFDQPPTFADAPIPDPLLEPPNNNAAWYARDDDVGQPTGFYWAVSTSQPPWYQRVRTEGANSVIDVDKFPIRLDFDPAASPPFVLKKVDWSDRLSGDSTLNPGPSFIGNAVSDIVFHQDRLFFLSGEAVVSSRAGDVFNLWISSPILLNDADPIDQRLLGNRTSIIDFGFSFQDALILLTRGARQVELRSNGPLAPSTAFLSSTTDLSGVEYARPTSLGSRLYFLGERDFANIVYRYAYNPDAFGNAADEITTAVQGFIPAEASLITASEAHQQLFILTDADDDSIYVYRTFEQGGQVLMNAWYKWEFDTGNKILTMQVFDDFLYLLILRDSRIYLERIPLGTPQQDTDNVSGPLQTMGYNIPIDRKHAITGTYDAATDKTTWVLPFVDTTINELILGPAWDQDSGGDKQRLAGLRFTPPELAVTVVGDTTELVVMGQFATNLLGDAALAFAGRLFKKRIRLSEQFFRDQQGQVVQGNLQLMTTVIRHKDTGFYALEVTPLKRSTAIHEFVPVQIGSTDFDSDLLDSFGEFQPRVLTRSRGSIIEITNDKPVPSSIVDIEFRAEFVPFARSPIA